MEKVSQEPNSGCWLWTGASGTNGYGFFCLGKTMSAHRASYLLHRGEIGPGLQVRHRCDNRLCVSPDHLELGSHQDNMDDRASRDRTARGERHPRTRFSDEVVRQVRLDYVASKSYAKTGRKFGMSKTQVGNIIRNEQRAMLV